METLAAIDIGSNAIRMVIGEIDDHGDVVILKKVREPVRLGKDVFKGGTISEKTRERALQTFRKCKEILNSHGVQHCKAVATAALREAQDSQSFIDAVHKDSGIRIELIDGLEEGRLVYSAVAHRVELEEKVALLIDVGGGSVELTLVDQGRVVASQSFKLGTVRMLQLLEDKNLEEKDLAGLIEKNFKEAKNFIDQSRRSTHIDLAIGTGGNFETLGKLRVALLHRNSIFSMTAPELSQLVDHLQSMSIKERIQFLRLKPDRADVVIPAALVTQAVMKAAEIDMLAIPYVGLRDGILADLRAKLPEKPVS